MKLNEFIKSVLVDINTGLTDAEKDTDKGYHIQGSDNNGVSFDIAVTTVNSSGSQVEGKAEGKAGIGFVEVVGVHLNSGVGAKTEDKQENSAISRIQFTIYVPSSTNAEIRQNNELAERKSRDVGGVYRS